MDLESSQSMFSWSLWFIFTQKLKFPLLILYKCFITNHLETLCFLIVGYWILLKSIYHPLLVSMHLITRGVLLILILTMTFTLKFKYVPEPSLIKKSVRNNSNTNIICIQSNEASICWWLRKQKNINSIIQITSRKRNSNKVE